MLRRFLRRTVEAAPISRTILSEELVNRRDRNRGVRDPLVMIILDVNMLVGSFVSPVEGVEVHRWIALVLPSQIPRSNNALGHVLQ